MCEMCVGGMQYVCEVGSVQCVCVVYGCVRYVVCVRYVLCMCDVYCVMCICCVCEGCGVCVACV